MIDRIKQLMEYYKLAPASFAEQIGINRSNLTHLFSGRNQPSLDLAKKILHCYPEIKTEWLIMGVGEMMRSMEEKELNIKIQNERKQQLQENRPNLFSEPKPQQKNEDLLAKKAIHAESFIAYPITESSEIIDSREVEKIDPIIEEKNIEQKPLLSYPTTTSTPVSKIVFFYSDNSFEVFTPK